MALGVVLFMIRAKYRKEWPFLEAKAEDEAEASSVEVS